MDAWAELLQLHTTSNPIMGVDGVEYPSLQPVKFARLAKYFIRPDQCIEEINQASIELYPDQRRLAKSVASLELELERVRSAGGRDSDAYHDVLQRLMATQALRATLLLFLIPFTCLLLASEDHRHGLDARALELTGDFIKLARRATDFRPLGSSYVSTCIPTVVCPSFPFTTAAPPPYLLTTPILYIHNLGSTYIFD